MNRAKSEVEAERETLERKRNQMEGPVRRTEKA